MGGVTMTSGPLDHTDPSCSSFRCPAKLFGSTVSMFDTILSTVGSYSPTSERSTSCRGMRRRGESWKRCKGMGMLLSPGPLTPPSPAPLSPYRPDGFWGRRRGARVRGRKGCGGMRCGWVNRECAERTTAWVSRSSCAGRRVDLTVSTTEQNQRERAWGSIKVAWRRPLGQPTSQPQ